MPHLLTKQIHVPPIRLAFASSFSTYIKIKLRGHDKDKKKQKTGLSIKQTENELLTRQKK